MSGRPYRSSLIPYVSFIRARRQGGQTWQEIADALDKEHGIQIGAAGVQRFFARTTRRKVWPLGMEPDAGTVQTTAPAAASPATAGGFFGGTNRSRSNPAPAAAPTTSRPHRSAMAPHLAFIREQRIARASWAQIADALRSRKGINVTRQAVAEFFGRVQAHEERQRKKGQAAGTQESRQDAPTASPRTFPASEPTDEPGSSSDPFAEDALDTLAPLPRRNRSKTQN